MKNAKELQSDIQALEAKLRDLSDQRKAVDVDKVKFTEQLGTVLFEGRQNESLENELAKCQGRAAALDAAIKHGQAELAKARAELFEAEKNEEHGRALDELAAMEVELSGLLHAIAATAEKLPKWSDRLSAIDALAKKYAMGDIHELYSIVSSSIPFEPLRGISSNMGSNAVYGRNKRR